MNIRFFDGSQRIGAWPPGARIAAYGDGLFETMRVHRGLVPWWNAHWSRLQRGAGRLRIPLPDPEAVRDEAVSMFADDDDGVLKLVVGRGGVGRGYAPSEPAAPQWMLSRHALPDVASSALSATWCETRLSIQPALAGIKHCNRLEQVLARAECSEADTDEGLMQDTEGTVVSATAANLFVLHDGRWYTPPVDRCGVAGVCRGYLLDVLGATQVRLSVEQVEQAGAVFLSNAVRGILQLARIGTRTWEPNPAIVDASRRLAARHPGFEVQPAMTERS
ncbi:MAG: aminodeoxychorismate lyase [Luteimonas sp.]